MPKKLSRRDFFKTGGVTIAGVSLASRFVSVPSASASRRRQDLPRLTYLIRGRAQQDVDLVQEAMSAIMAERIGATIELRFIEPGAFNDQMALINAAAEPYDMVFTAPWANNYYTNVNQEYLLPLDDLLLELAPGYWASMTPETWEAARVQGEIYGGINQQIFVKPFGPSVLNKVLDAIDGYDALAQLTSYTEMGDLLAAMKEYVDSDDSMTHVTSGLTNITLPEIWGYDPQDSQSLGMVVKSTDDSATIVNLFQTDEYRQAVELAREWYLAGYAPTDILTADEGEQGRTAGLFACSLAEVQKPGGAAEAFARWGWEQTGQPIAEPLLTTAGTTATLTGIGSTSANAELAAQYLELINTDVEFYNLLCKGIEGTHWEWADQAQQLIKPAGDAASFGDMGWNPNTDWMFGNVFNSYYSNPVQVGAWPETAELNRSARPSPALGFSFNRAAVETELASIFAVIDEFREPLDAGLVDPGEGIAALTQALSDAGIERVQEEMQRQIEEWQAANA